ncbi:MAG: cytidylate kinase-like family protein [Ramlibacter sp.]
MSAQVICISRAMLTGADTIATDVAKALGHRIVDEEIIVRAAQRRNLTPAEVASVERRKSFLASMVSEISGSSADVINFITNPKVPAPTDDLRQLIRDAIMETAEEGNVVIVAHAASYALARRKGVLRVLITGSEFGRVNKWLTTSGGKSPREAEEIIRESDAARANYLKRFYDVNHESPRDYDICLSIDTLGPTHIAELIVQAAKAVE